MFFGDCNISSLRKNVESNPGKKEQVFKEMLPLLHKYTEREVRKLELLSQLFPEHKGDLYIELMKEFRSYVTNEGQLQTAIDTFPQQKNDLVSSYRILHGLQATPKMFTPPVFEAKKESGHANFRMIPSWSPS
ncbi:MULTISPECIES: hypothetical protein [Legionella]|uniref:hypothetical protein n=1 Tax=Legionella TaxID=445 RepID=UPI000F8F762D|nr:MULTISPECIES: hypothetical protein [Legionella]MCP0913070.1 hypothetical protein [Legionella sp. 27cVA30]RUR10573.1 hypothetical protein ELY14_04440 [Legionella septentrionalis]